jgi:hypothetical protein
MDPINKQSDIDQWLESALSQYGKAEPRGGLESRVLASLRAERNRIAFARRWWWAAGMATATAVAIAVALWVGESGREKNRVSMAGVSTPRKTENLRSTQPQPSAQIAHPPNETAKVRPANRPVRGLAVATPKLEQFPSPQPLSEQEKILVSYVTKYPEIAALVAQDQAESMKRDRAEEAAEVAKDSVQ